MWYKKIELNVEGPRDRANQALQLYDPMEAPRSGTGVIFKGGGRSFVWSLNRPQLCFWFCPTQIVFSFDRFNICKMSIIVYISNHSSIYSIECHSARVREWLQLLCSVRVPAKVQYVIRIKFVVTTLLR